MIMKPPASNRGHLPSSMQGAVPGSIEQNVSQAPQKRLPPIRFSAVRAKGGGEICNAFALLQLLASDLCSLLLCYKALLAPLTRTAPLAPPEPERNPRPSDRQLSTSTVIRDTRIHAGHTKRNGQYPQTRGIQLQILRFKASDGISGNSSGMRLGTGHSLVILGAQSSFKLQQFLCSRGYAMDNLDE